MKSLTPHLLQFSNTSPSMRREWIEMATGCRMRMKMLWSPSMRREWIEIPHGLLLHVLPACLPPCGGSGLKFPRLLLGLRSIQSPSMRREWIEMLSRCTSTCVSKSPSMRREWIEMKSNDTSMTALLASPSMRREWIEMTMNPHQIPLHICLPPCGGSGLKSQ